MASGLMKAETPVLWPPYAKSWFIGKVSDARRDWGQEEKGTTEDEMAGWHHLLDGRKFERTLGVGDGQGGLGCWDSWGCKELDMTEQLNWTELKPRFKAVYWHSAYLIYMQSTSWEIWGWMKHRIKLESRLLGEISITSDMQMTPPLWQKAKKN